MKKKPIKIILAAVLGALFAVEIFTGYFRLLYLENVAAYPDEWESIAAGMPAAEVRKIAGVPFADGRGLKTVDRWEASVHGVKLYMNVTYSNQHNTNEAGVGYVGGIYFRKLFCGIEKSSQEDAQATATLLKNSLLLPHLEVERTYTATS